MENSSLVNFFLGKDSNLNTVEVASSIEDHLEKNGYAINKEKSDTTMIVVSPKRPDCPVLVQVGVGYRNDYKYGPLVKVEAYDFETTYFSDGYVLGSWKNAYLQSTFYKKLTNTKPVSNTPKLKLQPDHIWYEEEADDTTIIETALNKVLSSVELVIADYAIVQDAISLKEMNGRKKFTEWKDLAVAVGGCPTDTVLRVTPAPGVGVVFNRHGNGKNKGSVSLSFSTKTAKKKYLVSVMKALEVFGKGVVDEAAFNKAIADNEPEEA